jgi:branched-chain amino acid transport system ATP-binding protein
VALLELDRVTKRFGQLVVAEGLTLAVGPGEAIGIVGPNGAGKTSLFGMISGDLRPDSGTIRFDGRPITETDAAMRCRMGIGRTYQVPRPFEGMSVFENTLMAAQQGGGLDGAASYALAARVLADTGLAGAANRPAGQLGLLQRKQLELARALATRPRLLLLDEVAGGLTDPEVAQLVGLVSRAREAGVAVVWIEHVVRALVGFVDRLLCLSSGAIIGDGAPAAVLADRAVKEVFLGTEATAESLSEAGLAPLDEHAASPKRGAKPLLEVRDLTVHHGQLRALTAVDLELWPGEAYAIIGANGAGKSTLLRTLAGLHRASAGSIRLDGAEINALSAEERVIAGIALAPEGRRLFPSLSVHENLIVGAHRHQPGPWSIERIYDLFGWMRSRSGQRASQLSGGEQQALAIGRALLSNPRVLMLDEVSLGLAPRVARQIYGLTAELLSTGMSILIVEQDVSQAVRVASRVQCLLEGRATLAGRPSEFTPAQIEAAYFGLSLA